MTWGAVAVGGTTLLASVMGQQGAQKSQESANRANMAMSAEQLDFERQKAAEQSQQFGFSTGMASEMSASRRAREDEINQQMQSRFGALRGENVGRLDPYSQAGQKALTEQQALMGLSGSESQQEAFGRFKESPGQSWLRGKQEKALLRSSSAIGGLGGGNVRTALQEQAAGIASQDFDKQMARLGAVSGQGMQAGQSIAGMGTGPSYVQTGQDIGVGTSAYNPSQYASPVTVSNPIDVSGIGSSGHGIDKYLNRG